MKLAILTLPLNTNYGGILQAYALQTILCRMGHNALVVDRRQPNYDLPFLLKVGSFFKRGFLHWLLRRENIMHPFIPHLTIADRNVISQHTRKFIKEKIVLTDWIDSTCSFSKLDKYEFDGFVVGSDQVWRPSMTPGILNYFLDFTKERKVRRVAYAASLGVSNWGFSPQLTKECSILARNFDYISVREDSAIALLQKYLGVKSTLVLDPTFLLAKDEYLSLVKERIGGSKGVLTYVLDESNEKQSVIDKISAHLNLPSFRVNPKSKFSESGRKALLDCVYPPVENWIKGFHQADFIITDSFHGCIFSIIFNKQFLAIGNVRRGMARFSSLLKLLGLEDRLLWQDLSKFKPTQIDRKIDFDKVNSILRELRNKSIDFLNTSLKI